MISTSFANICYSPECRRRRIKCDEKQPQCGQCQQRGRDCTLQDAKFRIFQPAQPGSSPARVASQGNATATLRKESSPVVPKPAAPVEPAAKSQYSRPIGNHSGPEVPDLHRHTQELSITVSPPADEAAPKKRLHDPQSSEARSDQTNRVLTIDNGPDVLTAAPNERTQGVETFISKTAQYVCIMVTSKFRTGAGSRTPETPSVTSNNASANSVINPLKDTQEELFLLRHYSECIAPWYAVTLPKNVTKF